MGLAEQVRAAPPLRGAPDDYDRLPEHIGEARFVLIGEASRASHECYRERAAGNLSLGALSARPESRAR